MEDESSGLRLRIFGLVALTLFGALFARLWYLQVLETDELQAEALGNVVEQVYEEAPRGRILDRDGTILVDNEVVQAITVDPRVLRQAMDADERAEMFRLLAVAVSRSGSLTKVSSIETEVTNPAHGPFDDVVVAVDVDPALLVYIGERPDEFPGVKVVERTVRSYPYGTLAAHVLGYVGPLAEGEYQSVNERIDPAQTGAKPYQPSDDIGKTGIERIFEDDLRGVPGFRRLVVDTHGQIIDELEAVSPVPGDDVWLTIDVDLQALTERELVKGMEQARDWGVRNGEPDITAPAGSAVVMDPRNGDVLAMASFPTYDPQEFVNGISQREFQQLTSEENYQPILNRAIQGEYAPGSTFKLVTSYAALDQGVIGPGGLFDVRQRIDDTGTYVFPDCLEESDTCVFESPAECCISVNLSEAITVSSDVYFYKVGGEGFWRRPEGEDEGIQAAARSFGLGSRTGIQLPYDRAGAVPDRSYFDTKFEEGVFSRDGSQWSAGDTINLSIGQGDMLVTPTQLANVYATFANGGSIHQPNLASRVTHHSGELVREFAPRVARELEIPDSISRPILDGLLGVPRYGGYNGTARVPFSDPVEGVEFPLNTWPVAGKTGTAERDGKADTSLFAAFGPSDFPELGIDVPGDPEIAIAVVLEEAGFGSSGAAPVAARVMEPYANGTIPPAIPRDAATPEDTDGGDEDGSTTEAEDAA